MYRVLLTVRLQSGQVTKNCLFQTTLQSSGNNMIGPVK